MVGAAAREPRIHAFYPAPLMLPCNRHMGPKHSRLQPTLGGELEPNRPLCTCPCDCTGHAEWRAAVCLSDGLRLFACRAMAHQRSVPKGEFTPLPPPLLLPKLTDEVLVIRPPTLLRLLALKARHSHANGHTHTHRCPHAVTPTAQICLDL